MQLATSTTVTPRWPSPASWLDAGGTARPRGPQGMLAGPAAELLRSLPRGDTLTVMQPLGLEVVCLKGTLWITHDGDTLDHVLESGRSYTAKRDQPMLVHALTDARFIVEPQDD